MNQRIENWLLKAGSKQFAGVEIVEWSGTPIFHIVVLEIIKEEVITVDKVLNCQEFEELNTFFDNLKNGKNIPLHLMCSQRGIIHRQLSHLGTNPLQQVLPNAKANDFYYQIHDFVNVVSVIRLEVMNEILKAFEQQQFHVLNISLGDFGLYHLLPFINDFEVIQTTTHQFHFEKNGTNYNLRQFEKLAEDTESETITLGEERQDSRLLGAFVAAFDGLMLQTPTNQPIELLENTQSTFIQKQLFRVAGLSVLGIFFISLLINFLLFSNYTDKNQVLQMQVNLQQNTLQQLDSLKKEVESKQTFLQNNTLNQTSKTSYYADEIARNLPNDIQLTTLNLFPKQKEKRSAKNTLPRFNQEIIIKGKTKESLSFNDWKKELEGLEWIETVNIIDFGKENDISTFEILLRFE
jgi:Tfp pilus assembly protein PilN